MYGIDSITIDIHDCQGCGVPLEYGTKLCPTCKARSWACPKCKAKGKCWNHSEERKSYLMCKLCGFKELI